MLTVERGRFLAKTNGVNVSIPKNTERLCKGTKLKYRKHWSSEEGVSAFVSVYDALCLALKVFCWKKKQKPRGKT